MSAAAVTHHRKHSTTEMFSLWSLPLGRQSHTPSGGCGGEAVPCASPSFWWPSSVGGHITPVFKAGTFKSL